MSYRLAIFDLDGTLADSFGFFLSVQGTLARRHGFTAIEGDDVERLRTLAPRDLMRHVGLPTWKLPFLARSYMQLVHERSEPIALFEGVADALSTLHERGVALALVTSNSADNARRTLGEPHCGRMSHIDGGASMFGKARRLTRVLRATGVDPRDAIYMGDQIPDGEAARAAGMDFGAVTWGYAPRDALARCSPTLWFESPADLVRIADS